MSCDWDVYCVDCKKPLGIYDANHALEEMRDIVKLAPDLALLGKASERLGISLELAIGRFGVNPKWFVEHEGHHLKPIDEYGVLDGKCPLVWKCLCCGTPKVCEKDEGHPGACGTLA